MLISLKNVKISFGSLSVLEDISFTIEPGERVSLVGPGGCGKSTILKIILGLLRPDAGAVQLIGTDMVEAEIPERQAVLKKVGMAFQQGALFDFMTVRENLFFAMEHIGSYSEDLMRQKATSLLESVKLGRTEQMYPYELSGGMQRRVGIARALCTEPDLAIFDEPTAGLDPVTSTIILNMIHSLAGQSSDSSQLVVTSNVEIGIRFAERLIVINEGKVVADGAWKDLLVKGPDWVRHFLGTRFIGLDLDYAKELQLPPAFIAEHWAT